MHSKNTTKARRNSRGDSASTEDVLQPYLLETSKDWNPSTTLGEAGLSSPAVVNDIVFISTSSPGFYAFGAATGLLLWTAAGLGPTFMGTYMLGPAICGDHVVIGSTSRNLYIYSPP